ncbi:MAG: hypothetical protein DWQ08_09990 [Proteobacteria bacterium]|nr:MAG: hypothetical protein DWQ08_09990 [Pseudomonadota bacterium]
MALDAIDELFEDLYEPTKVYLFGKRFRSLEFRIGDLLKTNYKSDTKEKDEARGNDNQAMPPPRLERSLRRKAASTRKVPGKDNDTLREATEEPTLARIYSFAYEGHYYKLPRPLVYLVWGDGEDPEKHKGKAGPSVFSTRDTGLASKGFRFGSDIRAWKMDRLDLSVAIDIEVGKVENILLEPVFMMLEQDGAGSGGGSRMAMASRMAMNSRMAMSSRMAMASRMAMVGPHQE